MSSSASKRKAPDLSPSLGNSLEQVSTYHAKLSNAPDHSELTPVQPTSDRHRTLNVMNHEFLFSTTFQKNETCRVKTKVPHQVSCSGTSGTCASVEVSPPGLLPVVHDSMDHQLEGRFQGPHEITKKIKVRKLHACIDLNRFCMVALDQG